MTFTPFPAQVTQRDYHRDVSHHSRVHALVDFPSNSSVKLDYLPLVRKTGLERATEIEPPLLLLVTVTDECSNKFRVHCSQKMTII